MSARPAARRAALLFLISFAVFNANLRYTASFDSFATSLLPFRLLTGHGLTLSPAEAGLPVAYSIVPSRTGGFVSFYPVVTALLVTPLYVPVVPLVGPGAAEVARVLMEKLAASVLAAASVAFLFLALRRLTTDFLATLLSLAYALGTLTWAVSSQALWLQTGSEFLLAAALALLARGPGSGGRAALLGLVVALLAANRPTDGLFSLALAFLVWRADRRRFAFFAVPFVAVGAAQIAWNLAHFGHVLGGYGVVFLSNDRVAGGNVLAGVAGQLFSARGLLAFSPFLVALAAYRPARARLPGTTLLLAGYAASLVLHARAWDWWGGYCYGARYTLHGMPVLFVALAEVVERLWNRAAFRALFLAGTVAGIAVEVAGAFFYPAGDSGNAGWGLWSFTKAPPVVAFASGPRPPDFLGMLVPRLGMHAALPERDAAAHVAWAGEPPGVWTPNERRTLPLVVRNLGTASWKGLGGFMNESGVRLSVTWSRRGAPGGTVLETTQWLALRLRAGAS